MNSDQFMQWFEGYFDSIGESTGLLKKDVEVIRTKMASVEKPAAGNYEQNCASTGYSDANRERDARMSCLQIVLNARGQNYGNIAGVVADAAMMVDYVVAGVNPAGLAPNSGPMTPSERYEHFERTGAAPTATEVIDDVKRQLFENARREQNLIWPKSDPTATIDDTVEDLKRRHPVAHHQV